MPSRPVMQRGRGRILIPAAMAALLLMTGCGWELDKPLGCGDGKKADEEACDGAEYGGQTCKGLSFDGGDLKCTSACKLDRSGCFKCGDGARGSGETCDGADHGGKTCTSLKTSGGLSFSGGTLKCEAGCSAFDTSACYACGDNKRNGAEICDGTSLNNIKCKDLGHEGGTLKCKSDCSWFDESGCYKCGDGKKTGTDKCDGADLGKKKCTDLTFKGGKLACKKDCTFDTTACYKCGDGKKNGSDYCDGADLDKQTCKDFLFLGGTIKCKSDCSGFDTAGCYKCGDGVINGADVCDKAALGGKTCKALNWAGGTLKCKADCTWFDQSACYKCGDKKKNGAEPCDGGDLGGATCKTAGFVQGTLACKPDCASLDTTKCVTAAWVWATRGGGTGEDLASQIDTDSKGNIYVAGQQGSKGSGAYGPSGSQKTISTTNDRDIVLGKLDSAGTWQWIKSVGGQGEASVEGFELDKNDDLFLGGTFKQGLTFATQPAKILGASAKTDSDIWLARADAAGNWKWAVSAGGSSDDLLTDLALDSKGDIYICGSFKGTATFGTHQITSKGDKDIFLARLDTSGNVSWVKSFGSTGEDEANAIALDASGDLYFFGRFKGDMSVGTHNLPKPIYAASNALVVAKLDSTGAVVWVETLGGRGTFTATEIGLDSAGHVYLLGSYAYGGYMKIGTTTYWTKVAWWDNPNEAFLVRLTPSTSGGTWDWVLTGGGLYRNTVRSLAVDAQGNSFLALSFKQSSLLGSLKVGGAGLDMMVAKVDPKGAPTWGIAGGGPNDEDVRDLHLDSNGDLLVAGSCQDSAAFGATSLSVVPYDKPDLCVAKLKVTP